MPTRIDRADAVAQIDLPSGKCLACELLAGRFGEPLIVFSTETVVALLPRQGTVWGQVLVLPRAHLTTFESTPVGLWLAMSEVSHRVARALERVFKPARCYVASLGTAREDVPMSSPHLHFHVMPVMDPDARPRQILTWSNGVVVGTEAELASLREQLSAALAQLP